ncbi:MAG: UbiA family prenyltransferase [Candidatus Hodarchaeota archaeon]
MVRSLRKILKIIRELLILSRLEWGFIFSGVAFMLGLFYILPAPSIFIGWLSIYAFACGHFSLNGLFDKESDRINPRGLSLRNPLVNSTLLSPRIIYSWVAFIWISGLSLAWFVPNSILKLPLILVTFLLAISGSFFYSTPPIRLKARPFIDIVSTILIIGVLFPVWVGLLGNETVINNRLLFYGVILNILLVIGIHLPTILTDLETDLKTGECTTAVYLGWKKASIFTVFLVLIRIAGFASINIILMGDGTLIPSILPFFIGLAELTLALNLAIRKNREAALVLWKGVIITSIIGGILFGFLYTG